MAHLLFRARPGAHGELHGGLLGRPQQDPRQQQLFRYDLATARAMGILRAAVAVPPSWEATKQPWWNPALSACDQGQLGACVFFAGSRAREVLSLQAGHAYQRRSELWAYHEAQTKFAPTQVGQDTGGYGAWYETTCAGRGAAFEADLPGYPGSGWPYQDTTAALAVNPPAATFGPALFNRNIVAVQATTDQGTLKGLLAAGHCVMIGMTVCASLESGAQGTGNVPIPPAGDQVMGGHENLRIGYVDGTTYPDGTALPAGAGGYWVQLNSWGSGPADWFSPNNLLYLPYTFDTTQAPDKSGPLLMDATCFALAPTS